MRRHCWVLLVGCVLSFVWTIVEHPQTPTHIELAKSGDDVQLTMSDTSGPWRVVRSTTPHFNYQNVLLAGAASSNPVVDTSACKAPTLYYYDASDFGAGEIPADEGQPSQDNLYLTSLVNNYGWEGDTITINGAGFSAEPTDNYVYFGTVQAEVTGATTTALTVTVPTGVCTAPVIVQVSALTSNSLMFTAVMESTYGGNSFQNISSIVFNDKTTDATSSDHLFFSDMGSGGTANYLYEIMDDHSITQRVFWNQMKGLPMDPSGNLYLANTTLNTNAGLVKKYDAVTHAITTYTNAKKYNETDSVSIVGLVYRPDGIIFAADRFHNSIRKRDPSLLGASDFVLGYTLDLYMGMAMDSAQNLYFTSGGTLYKTPASGSTGASVSTVATGFTNASGIAIDESSGNPLMLLADRGAGKVYLLNVQTGYKEEIANGLNSPRAVAFGHDKVTGDLYYYVAEPTRILRLPDPRIRLDSRISSGTLRVLISKKGTDDSYPLNIGDPQDPLQTGAAQVKIPFDVDEISATTRVYIKVFDPASTAHYGSPAPNDNKDPVKNGGSGTFQNCLSAAYFDASPGNTHGEVTLSITNQYAGDNYEVGFSFQPFTDSSVVPTVTTGMFEAWKREYVEQDKMFKRGGLLSEDFIRPSGCEGNNCCGSGGNQPCNQIKVYAWTNVVVNDAAVVFDVTNTAESGGEPCTIQAISDPPVNGVRTLTLSAYLAHNYYASSNSGSPPLPNFTNGASGGIGVPSQGYYEADTTRTRPPYDDTFVEFLPTPDGNGAVPYLPSTILSVYDYTGDCNNLTKNDPRAATLGLFTLAWFKNALSWSNVFHLIGTACPSFIGSPCSRYEYSGNTYADGHYSLVSRCVFDITNPTYATALSQDATDHELAHQFKVNQCVDADSGHDTDNAWCGMCGGSEIERCLMNESRVGTNGIIKFGSVDMIGPRTACPLNTEAAIRTHTDPIGGSREDEMVNATFPFAAAIALAAGQLVCAQGNPCPPAPQEIRQLPFEPKSIEIQLPRKLAQRAFWYYRSLGDGQEWTWGKGQGSGETASDGISYATNTGACDVGTVDIADTCHLWRPGSYEVILQDKNAGGPLVGPIELVIEDPQGSDKEVFDSVLGPFVQSKCDAIKVMFPHMGVYHKVTNREGCPPPIIRILQEYPTSTYAAYIVYDYLKGPSLQETKNLLQALGDGSYLSSSFQAPYETPSKEGEERTFAYYWGEKAIQWREKWGNLVLKSHPNFRYVDEISLCLAVDQLALKKYDTAAVALKDLASKKDSPMAQKAGEYLNAMAQKGWIKN